MALCPVSPILFLLGGACCRHAALSLLAIAGYDLSRRLVWQQQPRAKKERIGKTGHCKRESALERLHFSFTQTRGQLVEYAVDELVTVSGTVDLGQFDPFDDHNAVRNVDALEQVPGGQAQDRQFNRVEFINGDV